ncbi:MAG TPA: tetratricopeptide repeat protein [Dissulfurispiraceae bacterium]|nr:tetratricopeptide repeat protein [Dissulfurispiraceae bacterium]
MGKVSIFFFLALLLLIGFFGMENKDVVLVKVPFGSTYEVLKFVLVLLSTVVGAIVVLLLVFVRDTKRVIDSMQLQRRQKKEAKIQEYYARALNFILSNRDENAKGALKDILKEDPEHIDALLRLGDIACRNEEYAKALGFYRNARDISPKNLQVLMSIESVLERTGHKDSALKILEEIIDIDGSNLAALYKKQSILEENGKWDDLGSLQKNIVKLAESDREKQREERKQLGYKYEYGRASLENGEIEKAEKAFGTLLKTDASFIPAYLGLVEVIVSKGETEEAINFLEKSYDTLNSPILLARLEDLLITVGEPGRLLRFYRNALSRSPRDNSLKFMLGKLYSRLEMVDDAIETLESIDSNTYSNAELYLAKGELYRKRNQVGRAMEAFRTAAEMKQPGSVPYRCNVCGALAPDWSGRCAGCGAWNTFALAV